MNNLLAPQHDGQLSAYLAALGLPGLVDLHVHFMPDRVQRKVWGFFDRLPEHGQPAWPIAYRGSEVERVRTLHQLGVTAFSTLNYAHRPGMAQFLNDYSQQFAARYPQAIQSATFFPEPGVVDQVEQVIDNGAEIFKVHVQVGAFSPLDPQLTPVWSRLAQAQLPVVIHCGSGPHGGKHTGPAPIFELVDRYPELVLVVAHMGMPEYRDFAWLAQQAEHVYLDTTMVGTDYVQEHIAPIPDDYLTIMAELGDKIVLGTDFPTIPYSYSHQIAVLHNWGLGDTWMRKVLWRNPHSLLGRV